MSYIKPLISAFFCLIICELQAQQIINAYAEVTAISGTTLTIGNYNISHDEFEVGDQVILMQMQGDVSIDETYSTSFGAISDIGSAGLYEDLTIESIVSGGTIVTNETLWYEDFEDLALGATSDTEETSWSLTYSGGGRFQVMEYNNGDNILAGNNLRSEAVWRSETIDISNHQDIDISMDIRGFSFQGGTDYIRLYYVLDGGTETLFQNLTTANSVTASFSDINGSSLQLVARMYCNRTQEYTIIENITVTGDDVKVVPASITLSSDWVNSYEIGTNSAVQLISYPKYTNYTTTSNLTALEWDGSIGGVFAIDVDETFTIEHDIDLSGMGFRGGDVNTTANTTECWENINDNQIYYTNSGSYGFKGEGVYKSTNANYDNGIGKIANGAGGASFHNAGGGGGGNFTSGGVGGPGWKYEENAGCNPSGGGLGGADLSDYISASRIYLGGAGGGGNQNNNQGTDGGDGGGIIIIKANEIVTNGGCASLNIRADGESIVDAVDDGGGGAGAGGSILFQVNSWSLDCDINVSASGGDGSDSDSGDTHGGGGGGGKGVIIFSGAMPTSDFSANNGEGTGGDNNSGGSSTADPGDDVPSNKDADSDGIVETEQGPLPVTLLYWKGSKDQNVVVLRWATATEINNDYFTIEKSLDGSNWTHVAYVEGQGSTSTLHEYELEDAEARSKVYYRLIQTDFDGQYEVFDVLLIQSALNLTNVLLYPNPNNGIFQVQLPDSDIEVESVEIQLIDQTGRAMPVDAVNDAGILNFDVSSLPKGQYLLQIKSGNTSKLVRVMIN